jgi:hypothetical protein
MAEVVIILLLVMPMPSNALRGQIQGEWSCPPMTDTGHNK